MRCGNQNEKVIVCYNGLEICIDTNGVPMHLANHRDLLGKCAAPGIAQRLATTEATQPPLSEAFPNPFNESTTLRFRTMATGRAQLRVYNALGQLVTTLYDQEAQADQAHEIAWAGKSLAEGLYTCRL